MKISKLILIVSVAIRLSIVVVLLVTPLQLFLCEMMGWNFANATNYLNQAAFKLDTVILTACLLTLITQRLENKSPKFKKYSFLLLLVILPDLIYLMTHLLFAELTSRGYQVEYHGVIGERIDPLDLFSNFFAWLFVLVQEYLLFRILRYLDAKIFKGSK